MRILSNHIKLSLDVAQAMNNVYSYIPKSKY